MTESEHDAITCPHCNETIPISFDHLTEVISRQMDARVDELRSEVDEKLPVTVAKLKADVEGSGEE